MQVSQTNIRKCLVCGDNTCGSLFRCAEFKKMAPEKRLEVARQNRLCFNCLRKGHFSTDCKAEKTCSVAGCKIKHTKFLHITRNNEPASQDNQNNARDTTSTNGASCNHVSADIYRVAMPVVKVKVTSSNNQSVITYALLDSGSTSSFCSLDLVHQLRSQGEEQTLNLSTLEKMGSPTNVTVHSLVVSGSDDADSVVLNKVYARRELPISTECLPKSQDLERWEHLRDLDFPLLSRDKRIQLLIGQDAPEAIAPLEVRRAPKGQEHLAPFATKTVLGWSLNGPIEVCAQGQSAFSGFVASELEQKLELFWKIDCPSMSDNTKGLSVEDRQALGVMDASVNKIGGHYEVAIPFRENTSLPDNKSLAERRLQHLAKKLKGSPKLQKDYTDGIDGLISKGYAEKVSEGEMGRDDGLVWYIPHHAVTSPHKSKLRIVFDCAAKYGGLSLNSRVLQGPDLTSKLLGVLLRFREYPIAVTSDIEAMFHQVKVPEFYRDVLRFLWWRDGNPDDVIDVYRMTVHLFGGTWSPSVCSYALQQTAKENKEEFGSKVIECVYQNFYVDDFLKSFSTEEEAVETAHELPRLLAKGGFRLCKWSSNSREVLSHIPESERAEKPGDLNLHALPFDRVLGVDWSINSDQFTYATKPLGRPLTRRGLLGIVCSIYDPLGFLTPFTVRGKKMVQNLAKRGCNWDEPLSEVDIREWQHWLDELGQLSNFSISRCIQPKGFGATRFELHHFSDASTIAYGSVSYIRMVNELGQVFCCLLMAKSKVAPLKRMTIPRLELSAAALLVKQDKLLRKELTVPVHESVFYTDSTIVLSYIQNVDKRFHVFVSNRLAIIHDGSTVSQWKHVKSDLNPADDVSRGLTMSELTESGRWTRGPEFLWENDPDPSKYSNPGLILPDISNDLEVHHKAQAHPLAVRVGIIDCAIKRHSSWFALKRTVAWILRFKAFLKQKSQQNNRPLKCGPLTLQELNAAEAAIAKYVQSQSYEEEIQVLQSGQSSLSRKSRIQRLDPSLSEDGYLICGRRTRGAKPRMILPKEHHVSALIVKHHHEMSGHSGREFVVAEVRQKYWIPGVRSVVRRVISRCFACRRLWSKPEGQRMGDLPEQRVDYNQPPFTHVGTDCFGPYQTKIGRKSYKRYGCLFTCLTTRAIHLEVLDSMDTTSFINALERFIARRGRPTTIWCDNGTNFRGAQRELKQSVDQWNQLNITAFLHQREIEWKFLPPGASHMGGSWERLIGSVKKVLSSVMKEQVVSDEALTTLMCVVEGILNNRPLTTVSCDANDLEPLTPNHLLLLRKGPTLPPGIFEQQDGYMRRRWRQVQYLADLFWWRWLKEYFPLLQIRSKWYDKKRNLSSGDIVLIVDNNIPRNCWQIGRVKETEMGSDGLVRSAKVETKTSSLIRPVNKLCLLEYHDYKDMYIP